MKKNLFIFMLITAVTFALLGNQKDNDLPPVYEKWLEEEVVYIITPMEREVFLKLQNNKERDKFIEAF